MGIRKSALGLVLLLCGLVSVLSLITLRNSVVENRFTPFSIPAGILFYLGNNPSSTGELTGSPKIPSSPITQMKASIHYAEKELGKKLTPHQASHYWFLKGLRFIKNNPFDFFRLSARKFAKFWRKEEISTSLDYSLSRTFAPIFSFPFLSFGVMAPFALMGIFLSMKNREKIMLVGLFILIYQISILLFFISDRYRLPLVPFLIMFSSYAFFEFIQMAGGKKYKEIFFSSLVLIMLFLGINLNFKSFQLPPSAQHHINLGVVYYEQGRVDEAIAEYRKALKINPNFDGAHNNLGSAYFKKGLTSEAIREYEKAVRINPYYVDGRYNLGVAYSQLGRVDQAIIEYKKALKINPYFAQAHNNLASAYYKNGEYNKAAEQVEKAIKLGLEVSPGLLKLLGLPR